MNENYIDPNQMDIFDFLEPTPPKRQLRTFVNGDKVNIRFYTDEVEFFKEHQPKLFETGTIVAKHLDFYKVDIADTLMYVEADKLKLI